LRRKILIVAGALAGVLILAVIGLFLYLEFGDLTRHGGMVGRIVTDAIGREFKIEGRLELAIGFTSVVVAEDVTLTNPGWCVDPAMVHVDRLEATVDLFSLFSDTIRIHDAEIAGASVALEVDARGRASWDFPSDGSGDGEIVGLQIAHAFIDGFRFAYRDEDLARPVEVTLDRAEIRADKTWMLDVDLEGRFRGAPLVVKGKVSSLDDWIAAEAIEHDLRGSVGDGEFATRGTVERLKKLEGVDLTLDASGPSLAAVGPLAGMDNLPEAPFGVDGRLLSSGFPCTFENVAIRLGDDTLSLDGTLGAPPEWLDTGFTFEASGPNVATLGALAGVDLPSKSYSVAGRIVRLQKSIGIENVEVRIGKSELHAHGTLGDLPDLDGSDLQVRAAVPDLSVFRDLVGIDLPRESFEIEGRLGDAGTAVALDGVRARLGENRARVDGTVDPGQGFLDTDVRVSASGPDLAAVAAIAGVEGVPREHYQVEGAVRVLAKGYALRDVEARVGDVTARTHGRVGPLPEIAGTDLEIHVDGPDLSWVGALAGRDDLPAEPYRIDGGVAAHDTGYELRAIDARIGDLEAKVEGRLGLLPDLDGTSVSVQGRLAKLSAVGPYVDRKLPEEPLEVRGSVTIEGRVFGLEDVEVVLGQHRLDAEGAFVPGDGLVGTDLVFEIAVPDLSEIVRFVEEAGIDVPLHVRPEVASLSGRVSVHEDGYGLHHIDLGIRRGKARVDGFVGRPPEFVGSDLTFEGHGPDGAVIELFTEYDIPHLPLRVEGRVEKIDQGTRFYDTSLRYGDYRVEANGTLGEFPKFIGTDFDLHAEGPSLEFVGNIAGYPDLPDKPFDVTGRFEGKPTRFSMPRLTARLGLNDLEGSFTVDLRDKPDLQAKFSSKLVNLGGRFDEARQVAAEMNEPQVETEENAKQKEKGEEEKKEKKRESVISDKPFDLGVLQKADIDLRWTIDELVLPFSALHDFDIGIHLDTGGIVIDPLVASVESGGDLSGSLTLKPSGDSYRMRTGLRIDELRFNLTTEEGDPSTWTPINVELDLDANGRSPHELASTLSGDLLVTVGEGRLDNSLVDLIVADFLLKILEVLNPFRKEEPFTPLECGVFVAEFTDGVADLKPLVLRTDKMTMTGSGKIRFESEKLDLVWATKPRKGIGLSASAITNSYIKLGGTLANPSLEMKPLEAVATTGVAVATAGLSVLAKGLWDRITAEANVCAQALKKIEKQQQKEQKKAAKE
jgi:uncharacterized protein involved in outer membrane biogenesis